MSSSISKIFGGFVLLSAFSLQTTAQGFHPTPSLRQLTRDSGYIFAGRVTAIEHATGDHVEVAAVRITLQVERGIRGVRTGQSLVIREWSGLWEQSERYRPGQRVLLFLYRPSKLGLTSPVAGPLGRFTVTDEGQILLDPDRVAALASGSLEATLKRKARVSSRDFVHAIRRAARE